MHISVRPNVTFFPHPLLDSRKIMLWGPFYQARVIIDSEINYNSDPLKIDFNFRSIISLRFMKRLIVDRKLKLISINYKVIIDFEKLQLILKSYN